MSNPLSSAIWAKKLSSQVMKETQLETIVEQHLSAVRRIAHQIELNVVLQLVEGGNALPYGSLDYEQIAEHVYRELAKDLATRALVL